MCVAALAVQRPRHLGSPAEELLDPGALRRGADLAPLTPMTFHSFLFYARTYVRTYVRTYLYYVRTYVPFFLLSSVSKRASVECHSARLPTACRAKHSLCIGPCKCPLDNCATVCRAKHSLCIGPCKYPLAKMAMLDKRHASITKSLDSSFN